MSRSKQTEFIETLAEKSNVNTSEAQRRYDAFISTIHLLMQKHDEVSLSKLGTFRVAVSNGRKGTNPKTQEEIWINPATRVRFSAKKTFLTAVERLNQEET